MKRSLQLVSVLLVPLSLSGCVSAKQKNEEQQELERSISRTSNPDAVAGCIFIMNLRPDGVHHTPEAQVASLVIPKPGVSWVILGSAGTNDLYSCKAPERAQTPKAPTPTAVEPKAEARTPVPIEAAVPPVPLAPKQEVTKEPTPRIEVPERPEKDTKKIISRTRVTNNPEAVKGCKFLESFSEYQTVLQFQENVVRAGGNVGYVVATNQNGDVIGESYSCSEVPKP